MQPIGKHTLQREKFMIKKDVIIITRGLRSQEEKETTKRRHGFSKVKDVNPIFFSPLRHEPHAP